MKVSGAPRRTNVHPPHKSSRLPASSIKREICFAGQTSCLGHRGQPGNRVSVAKDLAAHSFTVLVGSRNLEHGGRAAASIEGDARVLQLDVTDPASIDAAAERIRHELGRLNVPVNNAGIMDAERPGGRASRSS